MNGSWYNHRQHHSLRLQLEVLQDLGPCRWRTSVIILSNCYYCTKNEKWYSKKYFRKLRKQKILTLFIVVFILNCAILRMKGGKCLWLEHFVKFPHVFRALSAGFCPRSKSFSQQKPNRRLFCKFLIAPCH